MRLNDETELEASSSKSTSTRMIVDSADPSLSQSPSMSSQSTRMSIDLEEGAGDNDGNDYEDTIKDDTRVVHKTNWSCRKLRAGCVCLTLFILLFVFYELSFRNSPNDVIWSTCANKMSPPYVGNRTIGEDMCVTHKADSWVNPRLLSTLFPANREDESAIRFLVIGDFGRDGFCCQRDVAVEMERAAKAIKADIVVNVGDSFYDGGILTTADEQIKTSFLNVYNQPTLKSLSFLSVLGNHEYRGSTEAVIQVTNKHNKRFYMENRNWARVINTGDIKVQFVFIDTTPMIASYAISKYDTDDDIMLQREDGIKSQWPKIEENLQWLENTLQANKGVHMRIVVGHHPLYSYSVHKDENRTMLQDRVGPLLEKYNVTAYLAGHEHNLQFAHPFETAHFVSGGGSETAPAFDVPDTPKRSVQFYYKENGFLACVAYKSELRVAVVDMSGTVLDSVAVDSRTFKARR